MTNQNSRWNFLNLLTNKQWLSDARVHVQKCIYNTLLSHAIHNVTLNISKMLLVHGCTYLWHIWTYVFPVTMESEEYNSLLIFLQSDPNNRIWPASVVVRFFFLNTFIASITCIRYKLYKSLYGNLISAIYTKYTIFKFLFKMIFFTHSLQEICKIYCLLLYCIHADIKSKKGQFW